MRHFGAMPTRTAQPLGRIDSLAQLGSFSKNDIYYCSSKVIDIAQRWANGNTPGAHIASIKRHAEDIMNSSDPINAEMGVFIFDYMNAADSGMFGRPGVYDTRMASAEELECMKAIYWYEQEFLSQSGSGVAWNKANQIYVSVNGENVNSENVNLENVANGENEEDEEPFYKQTWFVALGSLVGVSLVGYIGYTIINK